jgi:hypothetical protein
LYFIPGNATPLPAGTTQKKSPFATGGDSLGPVNKMCIMVGTTVCGYGFGYLASPFGMMTEIVVSGIGSIIGVYLGWKVAQRIERG